MAYIVNRFDSNVLSVVADYTVDDTTLDIKLVGRHYVDYGEIQNENFVFILENFANPTPPPNPISGQLWFNSYKNTVNVFDGVDFLQVGVPTVSGYQPTDPVLGELWWDSGNEKLYSYNGADYILVGPNDSAADSIDFEWTTDDELYVNDGADHVLIGPNTNEMLALSHIL